MNNNDNYDYDIPGRHYKRKRSQEELNSLFTIGLLGGTSAFMAADFFLVIDHHLDGLNKRFEEHFLKEDD